MNNFLETVLTRIGLAVIVIDRNQRIRIWNTQARELWGLAADEAEGNHLLSLDIGLPMEDLKPSLRAIFSGASEREELVVDAVNRRGREFQCQVTLVRLGQISDDGAAAAIMMSETDGA